MVEKLLAWQLQRFLDEAEYLDPFRPGFRASLALAGDLWREGDGVVQPSSFLDLSAAFDTISHSILLGQLQDVGLGDTLLCWFGSFPIGVNREQEFLPTATPLPSATGFGTLHSF